MSAARKAAEEALAEAEHRFIRSSIMSDTKAWGRMAYALRALLAEQDGAGVAVPATVRAARYEAALRYYSDPQTYGLSGGSWDRIREDAGRKARAALAEVGK